MCTEASQAGHFLRDQLERHEPPKQYDQKDKGKFSAPGDGFAPLVDITWGWFCPTSRYNL